MVSETITLLGDDCMESHARRDRVTEDQWRVCLRAICDEAHASGVPPERLLRELKEAIRRLCDARAIARGPGRTEFTSRIVTMCIEEYFA
ncbi:MAG TPA: hypothetical protein VGP25_01575 [Gemmatimonadaceae bacterium]|nr:hypothetical protein [Gemmatimonadaceae bacterium]